MDLRNRNPLWTLCQSSLATYCILKPVTVILAQRLLCSTLFNSQLKLGKFSIISTVLPLVALFRYNSKANLKKGTLSVQSQGHHINSWCGLRDSRKIIYPTVFHLLSRYQRCPTRKSQLSISKVHWPLLILYQPSNVPLESDVKRGYQRTTLSNISQQVLGTGVGAFMIK